MTTDEALRAARRAEYLAAAHRTETAEIPREALAALIRAAERAEDAERRMDAMRQRAEAIASRVGEYIDG